MEAQILKSNESIKSKLPDIEKCLESIEVLEKKYNDKQDKLIVDYMVSSNLFSKAEVNITDKVCLWLGADVLCEYTFNEARELLGKNKENADITLKTNDADLDFIKDQITTCEVSKL
jgi:prefoldin subunit 5